MTDYPLIDPADVREGDEIEVTHRVTVNWQLAQTLPHMADDCYVADEPVPVTQLRLVHRPVPPLVDRCLDIMECAEDCATRDEERRLMHEVIDLVRSEDAKNKRNRAGSNPVAGTTTIHMKIAEPPAGQVVWDSDVPWQMGKEGRLYTIVKDRWLSRRWSDMPDTVVLATPPGGDR